MMTPEQAKEELEAVEKAAADFIISTFGLYQRRFDRKQMIIAFRQGCSHGLGIAAERVTSSMEKIDASHRDA